MTIANKFLAFIATLRDPKSDHSGNLILKWMNDNDPKGTGVLDTPSYRQIHFTFTDGSRVSLDLADGTFHKAAHQ